MTHRSIKRKDVTLAFPPSQSRLTRRLLPLEGHRHAASQCPRPTHFPAQSAITRGRNYPANIRGRLPYLSLSVQRVRTPVSAARPVSFFLGQTSYNALLSSRSVVTAEPSSFRLMDEGVAGVGLAPAIVSPVFATVSALSFSGRCRCIIKAAR
jgi:hypothetical protein